MEPHTATNFIDVILVTFLLWLAVSRPDTDSDATNRERQEIASIPVELVSAGVGGSEGEGRSGPAPTILTLTRTGALFHGGKPIELSALDRLPADRPLALRAEAGVPYDDVVRLLVALKRQHRQEVTLDVRDGPPASGVERR
ncbi:MAG: hypothetical protein HYZ53_30280 [Planctomycetes bacterium]|nr:hypothetical protein [Planctomycetota bacterium]